MTPRLAPILLVLAGCDDTLFGVEGSKSTTPATTESVSYYADVKPVLDTYCTRCHYDGGIAPFALDNYEDAARMASAISADVVARIMPPWQADDECSDYSYDFSLSDAQIATLSDWAEAGAPEGDAADEGAALSLDLGEMSRVDVAYTMEEAYTPQTEPDDYRCFVFDWDGGDSYITGMEVDPGEARVVHHAIAFKVDGDGLAAAKALDAAEDGYGYTCFGGPQVAAAQGGADWIGGWVPGTAGRDFPEGTGIAMEDGGGVILQVHYNTDTAGPLPDQTALSFRVDDSVDKVAKVAKFFETGWVTGADPMTIAAGDADASASYTFTVPADLLVYQVGIHMHQLGTSGTIAASTGGADDCMLDIPDWDFHWQGNYRFTAPVALAMGDTVTLTCHWDNSAGTSDVVWGEGTADEMCLGTAYVTLP